MILDFLAALQVLELAGLIWLALKGREVSTLPVVPPSTSHVDHGVWDVMDGEVKVGSVRADSDAWFKAKAEGKTFRHPHTRETR